MRQTSLYFFPLKSEVICSIASNLDEMCNIWRKTLNLRVAKRGMTRASCFDYKILLDMNLNYDDVLIMGLMKLDKRCTWILRASFVILSVNFLSLVFKCFMSSLSLMSFLSNSLKDSSAFSSWAWISVCTFTSLLYLQNSLASIEAWRGV